ncbi:MAG: chorismate-binding protein [Rhodoferax sp.]|nr:chorismate-binding protein [Rhodoferax sp.]
MKPPPSTTVLIDFCDPHGTDAAVRCAFAAPLQTLVADSLDQVKPVLDAVHAAAQQGRWCVGYVRYEAAPAFDAALQVYPADPADGPLAWFGVFAAPRPWPTAPAADDADTQVQWYSLLARTEFDATMARIHSDIAAGRYYQINYTTLLQGAFAGDPLALFDRLQRAQPGGYAAFIDAGSEQLLSVSPELFFDWQPIGAGKADGVSIASGGASHGELGGRLLTRPMKGTAPRGSDAAQDDALVQAMLASPKERAENVMIVDLLRNDVSRIAQPHSVQVPQLFAVQTLPTVHQMVSDVCAQTRPGTRLSEVFGALFPCGSITGAPKVQAMHAIRALEPAARGVYCGAVGLVRPGGHATFNVAIRTVTLRGTQARYGVGSGITSDATAPAEWQEWQHKRVFLDRASMPFELLETLRLESGQYPHLIAHLARLSSAAKHFGYAFDEPSVRAVLQGMAANTAVPSAADRAATQQPPVPGAGSAWRVRLRLDARGRPRAEIFRLKEPPGLIHIALAATPFEAFDSQFTRFKTTRRAHYEAFAPTDPSVFDTLLYNPAGELTECTRGNIALLLDGRWVTPPLHCGLLAGVGRAVALQEGRLIEAVVRLPDLPRVQAIAFINSLRGWLDARLTG